jgi:uncharacterized membrane protein YczE
MTDRLVKIMTSVAAPFVAVLLGIILVGTGLSLWIHPGLGMASAGILLVVLGKLLGDD